MIKQIIRQFFCGHNFIYLAKHRSTQQNLWICDKCGLYYIRHKGIGVGSKSKSYPQLGNWIHKY